jgi:hypothetical protein
MLVWATAYPERGPSVLKALPASVVDPSQALDAWSALARRLAGYGVRIQFGTPPDGMVSDWNPVNNLLVIRAGADLDDQVWVLQNMFFYLAIGVHAAPMAVRKPILSLVPEQRQPLDEQTA